MSFIIYFIYKYLYEIFNNCLSMEASTGPTSLAGQGEREIRICVIKRVSPNTPTTWCSRMVVPAKAGGSPMHTMDLQPQNRQSVCQTHHVSSPFHLAERVPQGMKRWTHGMGTTQWPFVRKTGTLQRSSHHGGATCIR